MNLSTPHDVDALLKQKGIGSVPDPFGVGAYTASDKCPAPKSQWSGYARLNSISVAAFITFMARLDSEAIITIIIILVINTNITICFVLNGSLSRQFTVNRFDCGLFCKPKGTMYVPAMITVNREIFMRKLFMW